MMIYLVALDFIKFRLTDVIDILLVAFLLFELYRLLKGTAVVNILWAIGIIYFIWKIVSFFQLTMLSEILGQIISVGVISLIILFQPEIRKFLLYIGNTKFIKVFVGRFSKKSALKEYLDDIDVVMRACKHMSSSKTGALIIMAQSTPLDEFINTGEIVDARMSRELLENIFFKNSPLHDGAVIILNHRIAAARCILPVSNDEHIPSELGLRHRSAIGSTTYTDAIAVVVSEQTGQISICKQGVITRDVSPSVLKQTLINEYKLNSLV